MTDIDKLIAAVEAAPETGFGPSANMCDAAIAGNWAYAILAAFNGSLDAALRLHEALLPGWAWDTGHGSEELFYANVYKGRREHDASGDTPARAWLLAILRALKEKGQ